MQRIVLQENNLNPNFIGSWMMEPTSVCDRLMDYFELTSRKTKERYDWSWHEFGFQK